ncbi:MAG TPA: hypothetical protein VFU02_12730, partial [Polyangiaceae bacterium]|nr:hypothetical protein [Polyangiaceae bacterium]
LDRNYLPALVNIAALACFHNDIAAAGVVLRLLEGGAGKHAVTGSGGVYLGPASYWLGRLHLTCGRREDAERQLEMARHESHLVGSVVYRAWSEYYLAQALQNEPIRAKALLDNCRLAAQRFGFTRLIAQLGVAAKDHVAGTRERG